MQNPLAMRRVLRHEARSLEPKNPPCMKKVFISYSHDSEEHRAKVLSLSERLRADGIETLLDQYVNGSPEQGWPRWMLDQLDLADTVLVVCTETYYRRFRGHEVPGKGKGADWEGALITTELYNARSRTLKFVPVFLSERNEDWIPEPLRAGTHYWLNHQDAYDSLYDFLMQQAGVEPAPVGKPRVKARKQGVPLIFGDNAAPTTGAQSASPEVRRPRAYLSYTWRTKGMKARALKLAERLWEAGIDVRIDFFYSKSLHGFTPPDPLPGRDSWDAWQEQQIRDAESVLVICTSEYLDSPPETGAWRDMDYMRKNLDSGRAEMRKFIPIGFGSYGAVRPVIPDFMKGANYYDLTTNKLGGFGFDDLVRRLKAELAKGSAGAQPPAAAAGSPSAAAGGGSAHDCYHRGLRFLRDQDYEAALDAFNQVIALDPEMAFAYFNRGLAHGFRRDDPSALRDFDRALALGFRDALLFHSRANSYSRKGDAALALADYAQAIALDPENALAYFNRAEVHENTLQKEKAIADYRAVLNLVAEPAIHDKARTRLRAMGVRPVAQADEAALAMWQKKLAFFQTEEAKAADAEQKFSIQQRIAEARAKIAELGG